MPNNPTLPQDSLVVTTYQPEWATLFVERASAIRLALGPVALRIDHVGSTTVVGLAAKPIIDVQVSVRSLEPVETYKVHLEGLGYQFRPDNTERTKRYFREAPGAQRTHIHVRRLGSWSEQWTLLFRDYIRVNMTDQQEYSALKRRLAALFENDRQGYQRAKEDFMWQVMRRADEWASQTGWGPGPSDA